MLLSSLRGRSRVRRSLVAAATALTVAVPLLAACTPAAPVGAGVSIAYPYCPSKTLYFNIKNSGTSPITYTFWRYGQKTPYAKVALKAKTVSRVGYDLTLTTQQLVVQANGITIWNNTLSAPPHCYTGAAVDWGQPTYVDNFDGTALGPQWAKYNSPTATPPRSPSTVSVGAGELRITGTWNAKTKALMGGGVSLSDHSQLYGKWEVRMKADKGAGFSPTTLLWPDSNRWPDDGEIDMAETGPWPNRDLFLAVSHNSAQDINNNAVRLLDLSQYHVYGVEWTPTRVVFYVDGRQWFATSDFGVVPHTSAMHLALQNDAGCGWIACPSATSPSAVTMHVDWVKQYALPFGTL